MGRSGGNEPLASTPASGLTDSDSNRPVAFFLQISLRSCHACTHVRVRSSPSDPVHLLFAFLRGHLRLVTFTRTWSSSGGTPRCVWMCRVEAAPRQGPDLDSANCCKLSNRERETRPGVGIPARKRASTTKTLLSMVCRGLFRGSVTPAAHCRQ